MPRDAFRIGSTDVHEEGIENAAEPLVVVVVVVLFGRGRKMEQISLSLALNARISGFSWIRKSMEECLALPPPRGTPREGFTNSEFSWRERRWGEDQDEKDLELENGTHACII